MSTRFERKEILGAPGCEVNAAGIFYKHQRPMPISKDIAGLPTVDLGDDYIGPVPPPGDMIDGKRLAEEVVCFTFHGAPPRGFWNVIHLDGNVMNPAADNVIWGLDVEFEEWRQERQTEAYMRSDVPPRAREGRKLLLQARRMGAVAGEIATWVESESVSGWVPIRSLGV